MQAKRKRIAIAGGEIGTYNGGEGKAGPFSATTATEGEKELL